MLRSFTASPPTSLVAPEGSNPVFSSTLNEFKNVVIETPIPAFGTKVISVTLSDVLLPLIVPRPAKAVPTFTLPNSVRYTLSSSV